jgi:DNA-binding transcriptional regulator LsrR (DeoR family)
VEKTLCGVLGPQKRGVGADPQAREIREDVAWQLYAMSGVRLSAIAAAFGVSEVRAKQLVDAGRQRSRLPGSPPLNDSDCIQIAFATIEEALEQGWISAGEAEQLRRLTTAAARAHRCGKRRSRRRGAESAPLLRSS